MANDSQIMNKLDIGGQIKHVSQTDLENNIDAFAEKYANEKVWVTNSEGSVGSIPISQLKQALGSGYSLYDDTQAYLSREDVKQSMQEQNKPAEQLPQAEAEAEKPLKNVEYNDGWKGSIPQIGHSLLSDKTRQAVETSMQAVAKTPMIPGQSPLEYGEKVAAVADDIQKREDEKREEYLRQMALPETVKELDSKIADIDKQLRDYEQPQITMNVKGEMVPNLQNLFNPNRKTFTAEQVLKKTELEQQKQALTMQRKFLDRIKEYEQYDKEKDLSKLDQFFRAIDINGDLQTFAAFGLNEIKQNQEFQKILDKAERITQLREQKRAQGDLSPVDLKLTFDEQKALILYNNMLDIASKDRGAWFNAGAGMPKTFEFMRDIALAGIGGGFPALAKIGFKTALKQAGKSLAKKAGEIAWKTPLLPGFYSTLSENKIGNYNVKNYGTNENPQWYVGQKDSTGRLIYKSWAQQATEYFTESLGSGLESIGLLTRIAKGASKAKKIIGTAARQYDKIHKTMLRHSVGKYVVGGLDKLGINSFPMEFVEEIANVPLQSLALQENKMSQLGELRFYQEVLISTAAIGGVGSAVNIATGGATAAIERKRSNKAIKDCTDYINKMMSQTEDQNAKDAFQTLLNDLSTKNFYNEDGDFDGGKIVDDITAILPYVQNNKDLFEKVDQLVKESVYREGQTEALKDIVESELGEIEYGTSGDVLFGADINGNRAFILGETDDAYLVNYADTKQQKLVPKSDILATTSIPLDVAVTNYFASKTYKTAGLESIEDIDQVQQEVQQQVEKNDQPLKKGDKAMYDNQAVVIEDVYTDANGQTIAIVMDNNDNPHNVPLADLTKPDIITDQDRYILPDGRRATVFAYDGQGNVIMNILDDNNTVVAQQSYPMDEMATFEKLSAQQANQVEQTLTGQQPVSENDLQEVKVEEQGEQKQASTETQSVPRNEQGQIMWTSMPIDRTVQEINSRFEQQDAVDYVNDMRNDAQKEVEKAEKLKPESLDPDARAQELEAIKQQKAQAQANLDYWNKVYDAYQQQPNTAEQPQPDTSEQQSQTPTQVQSVDIDKKDPFRKRVADWVAKGFKITILESKDQVTNASALAQIEAADAKRAKGINDSVSGWFDPDTNTTYVYMPHVESVKDIDLTIIHEVVAHKGMRALLGEERYETFCLSVWDSMSKEAQDYYMQYPGVNGNKAKAADEYIAYLAEKTNLTPEEQTIWDRIIERFRQFMQQVLDTIVDKNFITDDDIATLIRMSYANIKHNATPDVIYENKSNGQAIFSIRTYREGGRDKLVSFLEDRKANGALTEQQADDIIKQADEIYGLCENYIGVYQPFGAWSEADVAVDDSGKPVFSVIKANGDYNMNLDFSLVCKKRRTLDAVFDEMIRRGIISEYELGQLDIALINNIIRKYDFETACRLCFVDSRRFQVAAVADKFCAMYNNLAVMNNDQLDKVISSQKKTTVLKKTAIHLKYHPEDRIPLSRDNFMSANGFENIAINKAAVMKLYNSAKGTGGPKASLGDVQYLNDIIGKNWTPEKAYAVGGVRLQSFSDYIPRMVFDYVQMVSELAAKLLPVHCYTKEQIFVKQFGLTGIKINMSLVPRVDADGVAAGLDKDSNYAWQEGETFPYDVAIEIQNTPGYMENCGTIAVGVSDRHIRKMLADENIRMIIPYHKSGLNKQVAVFNNIDKFTDYTKVQNTRYSNGNALSDEDKARHFDFNGDLLQNQDPRGAAQRYLEWCDQNNYLPKFDQFRDHPNYYKLLEDFTTIITKDGVDTVVPQGPVQMKFPTENDAFGSMASLIEQGLEEDAVLEGRRSELLPAIVDEIQVALDESKKQKEEAARKKKAGKKKQPKGEVNFRVRTEEQKKALFDKSKEIFGTTNNFKVAGYMLPDGSLLDFSGKWEGGPSDRRYTDHRAIGSGLYEASELDSNYDTNMYDFINNGAIRLMPESAGIYVAQPLTEAQEDRLANYIYRNNGEVILEITNENGDSISYIEYNKRTSAEKVLSDIDNYFSKGIKPIQPEVRFRASYTPEMEDIKAKAEKDGTFMKAPNGLPTKLNEKQWLQVRTEAFKKWFGDWENDPENASKVVDKETGEPMVVYHGTVNAGFTEFKSGWFTSSKKDAISYSGDRNGRLYDENEKYEPQVLVAGDFRSGYMTFDSQEDLDEFVNKFPYLSNVLSPQDYETALADAEWNDETEYEALKNKEADYKKVWEAYNQYEGARFVKSTVADLLENPDAYTENDFRRALYACDSNAYLDDIDEITDSLDRKEALVEALQLFNEDADGDLLDVEVATRVPRNGQGVSINDTYNRTYEVFINLSNPLILDANGRGSELVSGDIYAAIDKARIDANYDGVIVHNWRVGRYQQLGDVVVPKQSNQIKLTTNMLPTSESSDIRFRASYTPEMEDIKAKAEKDGTFMKAPNGLPTKLNEKQWLQVRTEAFKNWFGDWENDPENASKVVDAETGEPLVVYHGTNAEFSKFDINKFGQTDLGTYGKGFYFTARPERAKRYGENIIPVFINARNLINGMKDEALAFVFGSPTVADAKARLFDPNDNAMTQKEKETASGLITKELVEEAKKYDGVDGSTSRVKFDELVVINPNQIKSATENVGAFSKENDDIMFRAIGGNRGYVGYSMSRRAAEAREEGRFPKTDFKKEYNVPENTFKALVDAGIISDREWHHTSKFGNKTTFYSWEDDQYLAIYRANKKAIDNLCKGKGLDGNTFITEIKENPYQYINYNIPEDYFSVKNSLKDLPSDQQQAALDERFPEIAATRENNQKWLDEQDRVLREGSDNKKAIRSAIEVFFDDNTSENSSESNIQFRRVTDPALLEKLNSEPTMKVYRAMQIIDGKLYPPMSAYIDGALREPSEIGIWEIAEENPELANDKGYFKLQKTEKKKDSLKARYNPYFHTSDNPLNDQFSSAQDRPNLVTVEVEIPISELTSGYKAEKAKDPVGEMLWKAGTVQAKLSGKRKVYLSRYAKIVGIVPDSKVAEEIVKLFGDRKITMPSNVVTPSLRAELEKRGVPFIETDNNGKPITKKEDIGKVNFRTTTGKEISFRQVNITGQKLRKLKEGEFCHVERIFTESKYFDFTAGETIESANDVAYIFSQLEDESVENSFAVLVKDGKPYVIHVGMGDFNSTIFNMGAVIAADKLINADQVYMVHNHPSGNLKASKADVMMWERFRNAFGDRVQNGIIINLKTGKYSSFNNRITIAETKNTPVSEMPIKVYSFNKQVFDYDYDPQNLQQITGSYDVAAFVSGHRLGDRAKLNTLILSRDNRVIGNIFMPYSSTSITAKKVDALAGSVVDYVLKMGGTSAIMYGSGIDTQNSKSLKNISDAVKSLSGDTIQVLDFIQIDGNAQKYESAMDEGVMFRYTPEMEDIKAKAERDGTFMKAPNGLPTKLNEKQWLRVRTAPFKNWFGDWEKVFIQNFLKGAPIVSLTGEEIPQSKDVKFSQQVERYFGNNANEANSPFFGKIALDAKAASRSIVKGMVKAKAKAFASVKDVIEKGVVISRQENYSGSGYERVLVAAPISIGNEDVICVVSLTGKDSNYRFESHEVVNKKWLLNESSGAALWQPLRPKAVAKILKNLLSPRVNASKIVDPETGEPMVVYHGTKSNFPEFDKTYNDPGSEGFFFTDASEMAESYGDIIMPVFLNIRDAYTVEGKGRNWNHLNTDIFYIIPEIEDQIRVHQIAMKRLLANGKITQKNYDYWYDKYYKKVEFIKDKSKNSVLDIIKKYLYRWQIGNFKSSMLVDRTRDFEKILQQLDEEVNIVFNDITDYGPNMSDFTGAHNVYVTTKPNNIKSAYYNNGDYSTKDDNIYFRYAPVFQSNALNALKSIKQDKATPLQWIAMLKNNGGLKAGEDKWIGLSDWLNQQSNNVTKQQIQDYIRQNEIQVVDENYVAPQVLLHKAVDEIYGPGFAHGFEFNDGGFVMLYDMGVAARMYDIFGQETAKKIGVEKLDEFVNLVENEVKEYLDENYSNAKFPNNVRLQYTTPFLQNNSEIALVVPSIESWNEIDDIHFGDAGNGHAVAWVRFGETLDKDGKSVLVIDEVQSKRHQDARDKGYRVADVNKWLKDNNVEVVESGEFYEFIKDGKTDRRFSKGLLHYDIDEAKNLYVSGYNKSDIPAAPFEKNWHELAMKRMLRYAAENGYEKIAWTTGAQQAERYDIGNVVDEIWHMKDRNHFNLNKDGYSIGSVNINKEGVIVKGTRIFEDHIGNPLSDLVGKDLAERMINSQPNDEIKPDGLLIGADGMKAFYDKILVDFMNKYGKKWGVKVEDVELPNVGASGLTMHSVEVTDSMKNSVLNESQVMFRHTAVVTPSDVAAKGLVGVLGQEKFDDMVRDIFEDLPLLDKAAYIKRGQTPSQVVAKLADDIINNDKIDQEQIQQVLMAIKDALIENGPVVLPDNADMLFHLWKDTHPTSSVTIKEKLERRAQENDIRFRASQKSPVSTNEVKLSRRQVWQERLVDRMVSLKVFYDELKKLGIKISDDLNPYVTENLAMSRSQTEDARFKDEIYEPMIAKVVEIEKMFVQLGLAKNLKDAYKKVSDFLYARHAPERNKQICIEEIVDKMLRKISKEEMALFKDENVRKALMAFASRLYNERYNPATPKTSSSFAKNLLKTKGEDKAQQLLLKNFVIKFGGIIDEAVEDMNKIFKSEKGTNRSGMSDAEAKEIMNNLYTPQTKEILDELSELVRQATHFTIDTWYKYSLINEKTKNDLKAMYKYYIPLRSWEEKEDIDYDQLATRAFNRASEIINLNRKARGRGSRADDPLAYIASLAQSAIVVGNKNMIRLNLFRLIKNNQGVEGLDQFATLPKVYYVDLPDSNETIAYTERPAQELFDKGLVETKTNKAYKWHKSHAEYDAHIVPVIINGTRQMIELRGELGIKVASAVNNTNVVHWQAANALKPLTNWLSAVRTSYNPEFVLTNFVRDFMFANLVYPVEGGSDKKLIVNLGHAFKAIHKLSSGKSVNSEWDAYYNEFLEEGGQTGFFAMRNIDQMKKEIEVMHKRMHGGKMNRHNIAKNAKKLAEYTNNLSESAMRLAVYITERQNGVSPKQAAYKAHEISVNFNRKGTWSSNFGAFYSFFNASVQGTARLFSWANKYKKGAAAALTAIALTKLATNIIAAAVGGDDYDDLSDYVKFSNIVIPVGKDDEGKTIFFCIPMAQGIRAVTNISDNIVDVFTGDKTVGQAMHTQLLNMMGEFLPLSFDAIDLTGRNTSYSFAVPFMPTAVQPLMDIWTNTDFKGDPIYKEPYIKSQEGFLPEFNNVYKGTSRVLVGVSKYLNRAAGGSDLRSSAVGVDKEGDVYERSYGYAFDWNPAKVEHLLNAYLGGFMTLPSNLVDVTASIFDPDEDIQARDLPVVNRFFKKSYKKDGYEIYYETKEFVDMTNNSIRAARKSGDLKGAATIQGRNADLIKTFKAYDERVKQLNELLKKAEISTQQSERLEAKRDEIINKAAEEFQKIIKDEKDSRD